VEGSTRSSDEAVSLYHKIMSKLSYQPVLLICGVLGALATYLFTTFAPGVDADLVNRIIISAISFILAAWAKERVTPLTPDQQQSEKDEILQRIDEFQSLIKLIPNKYNTTVITNALNDVEKEITTIQPVVTANRFGFLPSPVDHRDHLYSLAKLTMAPVALPYSWDWNDEFGPLPVLNQGDVPACVGYSLAAMKIAQERFETGNNLDFNGLSIYNPIALPEGGAYIRDGLKYLQKTGLALPGSNSVYRIYSYAGLDPKDHESVKHAIYKWGCVSLGFEVPASFLQGGGKEFGKVESGDQIVGGHAIIAVGYSPSEIILHNSWGTSWGNQGRGVVSWEWWDTYVSEAWVVIDAKDRV
jgi:C1A family cysteine protease